VGVFMSSGKLEWDKTMLNPKVRNFSIEYVRQLLLRKGVSREKSEMILQGFMGLKFALITN